MVAELRSYLVGWRQYFRLADTPQVFAGLDKWMSPLARAAAQTVEARPHGLCGVAQLGGAPTAAARGPPRGVVAQRARPSISPCPRDTSTG